MVGSRDPTLSFACGNTIFSALSLERLFFLPLNVLDTFVENQLAINVSAYSRTLNSVPLIHVSILTPIALCLAYCSFIVILEIGSVSPPTLFFSFKVIFATLGPLQFFINFRNSLSIFVKKKLSEILIWRVKSINQFREVTS